MLLEIERKDDPFIYRMMSKEVLYEVSAAIYHLVLTFLLATRE